MDYKAQYEESAHANSFTMRALLELHGFPEEIHNPLVTREIGKGLRAQGYKNRRVKHKGVWYSVWSNFAQGSGDKSRGKRKSKKKRNTKEIERGKEIAEKVLLRLPLGRVKLPGAAEFL